jgi:nitrite reductase/ring-hydroxylating ferredoxin subunit
MLEPKPPAPPQRICASEALQERGKAQCFDVIRWRETVPAFVLRFEGRVVAYLNRCAHVPTEMDWQEGEFLDQGKDYIICSIHGAVYDPRTGRCVMGQCGRIGLTPLEVSEREGQVYWHPSADIRPVFED